MTNILAVTHKTKNKSWIISDRQVTYGGIRLKNKCTKVFKYGKSAFGIAGDASLSDYLSVNILPIIDYIESNKSENLNIVRNEVLLMYRSIMKVYKEKTDFEDAVCHSLIINKNILINLSDEDVNENCYSAGEYYFDCIGSHRDWISGYFQAAVHYNGYYEQFDLKDLMEDTLYKASELDIYCDNHFDFIKIGR